MDNGVNRNLHVVSDLQTWDSVGLEAAHIKWHAYYGPDEVSNGLALCTLHHKASDLGGISLLDDLRLVVSDDLHGQNRAVNLWFPDHKGNGSGRHRSRT